MSRRRRHRRPDRKQARQANARKDASASTSSRPLVTGVAPRITVSMVDDSDELRRPCSICKTPQWEHDLAAAKARRNQEEIHRYRPMSDEDWLRQRHFGDHDPASCPMTAAVCQAAHGISSVSA